MEFYNVDKQALACFRKEIENTACMIFLDELIKRIAKSLIDSQPEK